ncbi:TetR/AcrR family transcriptional regulator [Paenibacillus wenxiniae]|uniref:TetR/AcrR family transcriptional regulator n=1 Tax=Paenibacillus wenxiniae TaxID=1636843 RepID=A0ABW4RJD7_9BACL
MNEQESWHQHVRSQHREELIGAGQQLFMQRNFPDIRVNDICKLAGMSRVTFYKHFNDINEVVFEVQMRILTHMTDWLVAADRPERTGYERLKAILHSWVDYARQHGNELRFIVLFDLYYDGMPINDELRQRYEQFVYDGQKSGFLLHPLQAGIADGSLFAELDPDRAGTLIFQTIMGVLQRLILSNHHYRFQSNALDEMDLPVITMLLHYVASSPDAR